MPKEKLSHEDARVKVCAVSANGWGEKAVRRVTMKEEEEIRAVIPDYRASDSNFPSGICKRCMFQLRVGCI